MSGRSPGLGRELWRTTYCPCGCRAVRLHIEAAEGKPIVTIRFDAAVALDLARHLAADAEGAVPGLAQAEARAAH